MRWEQEGQDDSDTMNKEAAVRTMVGTHGLPQTWRNAHCWTWPGSQKRATKQKESTQSCAVTPKDARREEEHRTASIKTQGKKVQRMQVYKVLTKQTAPGTSWQSSGLHVTETWEMISGYEMLPLSSHMWGVPHPANTHFPKS